jgi:hypothetical protein
MGAASRRRQRRDAEELIDPLLVKAMRHPLRVQIMTELDRGPMSPAEYRAQFGGNLEKIAYHFRILKECECVVQVGEDQHRGAVKKIYKSVKHALFSAEHFSQLPESVKGGFSASIISTFMDVAQEALMANTVDSHASRHLEWQRLCLDEEGFATVMTRLDETYEWLCAQQMAAVERMKKSTEEPLNTTVGIFAFECPWPEREHDLPAGHTP